MKLHEIRLITILPPETRDCYSDTIAVSLDHVPLDDLFFTADYKDWLSSCKFSEEKAKLLWYKHSEQQSPLQGKRFRYTWGDYIALSYTWSSELQPRMITVNGTGVYVGQNLEAALRAIRNRGYLNNGIKLWIDAISINQEDNVEKGTEVARMVKIYSGAADILIWLGYQDPDMCEVMDFISKLSGCWNDDETTKLRETLPKILASTSPKIWSQFLEFAQLPYWGRTWILQEIAAGSADMSVLYADKFVKWSDLYNATIFFKVIPDVKIGNAIKDVLSKFPEHKRRARNIQEFYYYRFLKISDIEELRQRRGEPDLMKLFTFSRGNVAARPRDKIYGLLAIMNRQVASNITAEYGSDVTDDDVFEDFARKWIEHGHNLDILGQSGLKDSPSWVPHLHREYRHLQGSSELPYTAGTNAAMDVRFTDDGQGLICNGLFIDTVESATTVFFYPNLVHAKNYLFPSSSGTRFGTQNLSNAYGNEAGAREALWHTLIGNRSLEGDEVPRGSRGYPALMSSWSLELPDMTIWIEPNADFCIGARPLASYFEKRPADVHPFYPKQNIVFRWLLSWSAWLRSSLAIMFSYFGFGSSPFTPTSDEIRNFRAEFEDAAVRVTRFTWSRRLFTTREGFMGAGPEETRPGDVVAILFGCSVPVLLRPEGTRYRLIKPCYIHGFVNGEAITEYEMGMRKSSDFNLF